ncbi:DUF6585 family protein [Reticulibacter mediterranei]|nr:DUF6585 family protein [Reticulibacter mediterranei]
MSDDYSNATSSTEDSSEFEGPPYTALPYIEMPSPPSHPQPAPSVQQGVPLTEEARLAAGYQLGSVLKCYKSEPTAFTTDGLPSVPATQRASGLDASGAFAFILIPTLVLLFLTRTPPWPLIMICLLILAPWLSNVIGRLPGDVFVALQNTEFYLCTNGIMIIKWTRVRAIRWEQIRTVQYCRAQNILHSSYILYPEEGKPIPLNRSLVGDRLSELAEVIEHEVRQRQLPGAIAAYEAGQVLSFGSINVTTQGLTLEIEQRSLSWQRFASVGYYNGYSITLREGVAASPWQKIEVARMLNLCVFLPLTAHIKNSLLAARDHNAMDEESNASDEEMEWMRQMQKEMLERLRNQNGISQIPAEVVEALQVLNLPTTASFDVIHQRYRQLAKQYHPDTGGDPETFKRIDAAYKRVIAWIASHE